GRCPLRESAGRGGRIPGCHDGVNPYTTLFRCRAVLWRRGDCLKIQPEEITEGMVAAARLLHIDGQQPRGRDHPFRDLLGLNLEAIAAPPQHRSTSEERRVGVDAIMAAWYPASTARRLA